MPARHRLILVGLCAFFALCTGIAFVNELYLSAGMLAGFTVLVTVVTMKVIRTTG